MNIADSFGGIQNYDFKEFTSQNRIFAPDV